MTKSRLLFAAVAAAAFALALGCEPPKPAICDSLARVRAAATSKAATCSSADGGATVTVDFHIPTAEECNARQSGCTENDKELLRIAADCADRYPSCDPSDGGVFGWAFGFGLGCASTVQNVSPGCQRAVQLPKDGG